MRGRKPVPFIERAVAIIAKAKKDKKTGCIIRQTCLLNTGYSVVKVTPDGKVHMGTHRFIWTVFRGKIPEGVDVLHTCDNRACINIDHLMLGNDKINMRQMCERGRGINSYGKHKLTAKSVRKIREDWKNGIGDKRQLEKKYNVCRYYINRIISREYWGWLK